MAAAAGLAPTVNVHSGKWVLIEEIELMSGLSVKFVILFNQLLKWALSNQDRLSKFYSRFSFLLKMGIPYMDIPNPWLGQKLFVFSLRVNSALFKCSEGSIVLLLQIWKYLCIPMPFPTSERKDCLWNVLGTNS